MRIIKTIVATVVWMAVSLPVLGNDSMATLETGGLVLTRNEQVAITSEDLYISMDKVEVRYVFTNLTDKDITTLVAFPMPDIEDSERNVAIPNRYSDNFVDFEITVDGKPVQPRAEVKAFINGKDITELLKQYLLPLNPFVSMKIFVSEQDSNQRKNMTEEGFRYISQLMESDILSWTLKTTYYWEQTFPAGRSINVFHRYTPSVGGSVGSPVAQLVSSLYDDDSSEYGNYCVDQSFLMGLVKMNQRAKNDKVQWVRDRLIEYVLVTGANWAGGTIGDFRLVVDKGKTENMVSFCGEGVKKIAPTQFEMRRNNFKPAKNLSIFILSPFQWD